MAVVGEIGNQVEDAIDLGRDGDDPDIGAGRGDHPQDIGAGEITRPGLARRADAGFGLRALEVTVDGDVLTISGNRPGPRDMPVCSYREAGIAYGDFSAEIYIPDQLVIDEATATYQDGMLTINIPMAEQVPSSPKRIALSRPSE